jgi:hypothetical protein
LPTASTGRAPDRASTWISSIPSPQHQGLPVIASGGCGSLSHPQEALRASATSYVLVNIVLHTISEVREHLFAHPSFGTDNG